MRVSQSQKKRRPVTITVAIVVTITIIIKITTTIIKTITSNSAKGP
jgi:hypothetical protein